MKAATSLLAVLLPLQAGAQQPVDLTLNCRYETSFDTGSGRSYPTSGSFSAKVNFQTGDKVIIEATTLSCSHFTGTFTDLQVGGNCKRTTAGMVASVILTIDRITGEFHEDIGGLIFNGHCTPGKKFF